MQFRILFSILFAICASNFGCFLVRPTGAAALAERVGISTSDVYVEDTALNEETSVDNVLPTPLSGESEARLTWKDQQGSNMTREQCISRYTTPNYCLELEGATLVCKSCMLQSETDKPGRCLPGRPLVCPLWNAINNQDCIRCSWGGYTTQFTVGPSGSQTTQLPPMPTTPMPPDNSTGSLPQEEPSSGVSPWYYALGALLLLAAILIGTGLYFAMTRKVSYFGNRELSTRTQPPATQLAGSSTGGGGPSIGSLRTSPVTARSAITNTRGPPSARLNQFKGLTSSIARSISGGNNPMNRPSFASGRSSAPVSTKIGAGRAASVSDARKAVPANQVTSSRNTILPNRVAASRAGPPSNAEASNSESRSKSSSSKASMQSQSQSHKKPVFTSISKIMR